MKEGCGRILLVSSHIKEIWPVALILTRLGHIVHVAAGGRDGLKKSKGPGFNLVVVLDPLLDIPTQAFFSRLKVGLQERTLIMTRRRSPEKAKNDYFIRAREVVPLPSRPVEMAALICEQMMGWGTEHLKIADKWAH